MKLLISDFEGTLVDFQWRLEDSINEMCKIIKGYNINYNLNLPIERLKRLDYARLYNYFQNDHIDDPLLKSKIIKDFDRVYDFYDEDAAKRWTLQENAKLMLRTLNENGVKIALCSNVGRNALNKVLKRLGINHFFAYSITRDDVKFLKPNPEGIKRILKHFEINEHDKVFFLGDSITDVITAKRAKIPVIILTGDKGENKLEEIVEHQPEHIVNNLKDVLGFM